MTLYLLFHKISFKCLLERYRHSSFFICGGPLHGHSRHWYTVYHLDASADSVIVYPVHRRNGTSLDIVIHVTGFEMCDI